MLATLFPGYPPNHPQAPESKQIWSKKEGDKSEIIKLIKKK